MLDPQQGIFSAVLIDLEAQGYDVYDGFMPPEGTPYPFIYLGDCRLSDDENKSAVFGNVYLTIHVWHNNPRQRGTVSQMLLAIKNTCRMIEHAGGYSWSVRSVNQQIITDTTTSAPLMHGVLEVEFKFC